MEKYYLFTYEISTKFYVIDIDELEEFINRYNQPRIVEVLAKNKDESERELARVLGISIEQLKTDPRLRLRIIKVEFIKNI
jgi:Trp operon repressor